MPIFVRKDGRRIKVDDEYTDDFAKENPDAATIQEVNGKRIRVKAADYKEFLGEMSAPRQEKPEAPASAAPSETPPEARASAAPPEKPQNPMGQGRQGGAAVQGKQTEAARPTFTAENPSPLMPEKLKIGEEYWDSDPVKPPIDPKALEEEAQKEWQRKEDAAAGDYYSLEDIVQGKNKPVRDKAKERRDAIERTMKATALADDPIAYKEWQEKQREEEEAPKKARQEVEERQIRDAGYKPRPLNTAEDVVNNARDRFALTKHGGKLQAELARKEGEVRAKYLAEFQKTDEYNRVANSKLTDKEKEEKLQGLFQKKYGDAMGKELQPYEDAFDAELRDSQGGYIDKGLKEVGKKGAVSKVGELQGVAKELGKKYGTGHPSFVSRAPGVQYAPTDKEISADNVRASKELLKDAQNVIDAAGRKGNTNFFKELGIGTYDKFDTAELATLGLKGMVDEAKLLNVLRKAEKGGKLTDDEELLLDASSTNMVVNAYFGSDLSRGYKAGQTTAESIPFMVSMVAGSGVLKTGNQIAKGLLKHAMKKYGAEAVNKAAWKWGARAVGDMVHAGEQTATFGLPGVVKATQERLADNYEWGRGIDGGMEVEKTGDVSVGEALAKGATDQYIENYSEMFFGQFGGGRKVAGKMLEKVGARTPELAGRIRKTMEAIGSSKLYKAVNAPVAKELRERAKVGGVLEEYAEEKVAEPMRMALLGEGSWDEFADTDKNLDTFLGLAPTSAAFSLLGIGASAHDSYITERRLGKLYEGMSEDDRKRADELLRISREDGHSGLKEALKAVLADKTLSKATKRDLLDISYYDEKRKSRERLEAARPKEERDAEESFRNGYEASDNDINGIMGWHTAARARLDKSVREQLAGKAGAEDTEKAISGFFDRLDNDPEGVLDEIRGGTYEGDPKLAIDYINAKQMHEGVMRRVKDNADGRIEDENRRIDLLAGKDGYLHAVTLKRKDADGNDVQAYVKGGNVVMYEDGTGIDPEKSDKSIIISDGMGNLEMVSPDELLSVYVPIPAELGKEAAVKNIREEESLKVSEAANGTLPMNPGDEFTVTDGEGGETRVTVAANDKGVVDNGDGTVNVTDGTSVFPMDKAVLQEQAAAREAARVEEEYSRRTGNGRKEAPVREYAYGDTVTLRGKDGNTVRGKIDEVAGDDGFLVAFDEPMDGKHVAMMTREDLDGMIVEHNGELVGGQSETGTPAEGVQPSTTEAAPMQPQETPQGTIQETPQETPQEDVQEAPVREYADGDTVTLRNEDGKTVMGKIDEVTDYFIFVEFGDGTMAMMTREDLDGMIVEHNGELVGNQSETTTEAAPMQPQGTPQGDVQGTPQNTPQETPGQPQNTPQGTIQETPVQPQGTPQGTIQGTPQPSALERIPKDDNGEPIYEQTDADTAWDAIVEQTEGDEEMAKAVADSMVADKEAELKRAEKAKPKAKGRNTVAGKIAAERERRNAVERAKADLAHWQKIAYTAERRRQEERAKRAKAAEEAARLRREREERERAEREEAERVRREALNGVPDIVNDKPQDARARGYRRVNGHKVDRQEPLQARQGKEVRVKFDDKNIPEGRVSLIEAEQLQPSHLNGMRNPSHFIDEAQPKERKDEASVMSARKIAADIRPEEITSSVTAYTGAPTVNTRGEVIQGNNRSAALREMWAAHPGQAEKYKQYLADHAEDFGLTREDVEAMQHPVLVNMMDVPDDYAVTLGQFVAQDTESGGVERIKPKNMAGKMGSDMGIFAGKLLQGADDEASFAELVDRNGADVLKWMNQKGYITPTQYGSAFDSKGNLTAEAKNDLKGMMYQGIFRDGNTHLEEMFGRMTAKAQKAILATAYRDYDSPNAERLIGELQDSIEAYYALSQYPDFAGAKNYKEARLAVEEWKRQAVLDDVTGESYFPSERYSNFALLLATMYKGQTQTFIQNTFNAIYDLVQGTREETLFEKPDNTPRTLAEAINEVINGLRPQLLINGQFKYENGQRRSNVLAGGSAASQQGRQGSTGNATAGGRVEDGDGATDNRRGFVPSDAERGGQGDLRHPSGRQQGDLEEAEGEAGTRSDGQRNADRKTIERVADEGQGGLPRSETEIKLSDEVDENGHPFVISSDGTEVFGEIREESGLTPAPIKLSEGFNNTDEDGNSVGYGLLHVDARHGDEIRNAGYSSVQEFVEYVARNYKEIRFARDRKSNKTYMLLGMYDAKHKGTLYIELSHDGSYWNVNSAGIFKNSYTDKNGIVWPVPTVGSNVSTDNAEVVDSPAKAAEGEAVDRGGDSSQTTVSKSKVSKKPGNTKESGGKIAKEEKKADTNPTQTDGYTVERRYHKKNGTYINAVKFTEQMPRERFLELKKRVKDFGGYYSSFGKGGFIFGNEEDAHRFAHAVLDKSGEELEDAKPLSLADTRKVSDKEPKQVDVIGLMEEIKEKGEAKLSDHVISQPQKRQEDNNSSANEEVKTVNPSGNRLVTDERYEELKKRMKAKLGQLNVGIDPEIIAIGTEMAVYHIERGARKFADYARALIADMGDVIRPYLKSFYNAVRDMPEAIDNGLVDDMSAYDEVRSFDVANFDKQNVDALATAELVVQEQELQAQADDAKRELTRQRNEQRRNEDEQTTTDTEAIASQAEAIAGEEERNIENATDEQQTNEAVETIDKQIEEVNKQLALLGYYEADPVKKDFNEEYGYMRNAEKKAAKDASSLAKRLAKDLGIENEPIADNRGKQHKGYFSYSNIAPAGGEIYIFLPLGNNRELQIILQLSPDEGGNLHYTGGYMHIQNNQPQAGERRWSNKVWLNRDDTYQSVLDRVRQQIKYHAPGFVLPAQKDVSGKDKSQPKAEKINKKEVSSHIQGSLFDDLFNENATDVEQNNSNRNEKEVHLRPRTGTAERERGHEPRQDEPLGTGSEHEAERPDGRGVDRRDTWHSVPDEERSGRVSQPSQGGQRVEQPRNTRNNHAGRGVDYAPKGEKARTQANIAAIRLAKRLLGSGAAATPEEMEVLRQYSGWGGLGSAFNKGGQFDGILRELLTPEEYESAVMSRNSAYYTPASVIDALWDVAVALGFKGGNVLEGSAGIGNIIGQMPSDLSGRSDIHAVEIDNITGGILSLLYPDAKVDVQGFEKTSVPNGSVDLAITNVPFVTGLHVMDESGDSDLSKKFRDIHDFCIAKNVRKLREGGIGIFITSSGTLDKSQKLRNWLVGDKEGNVDVVGAFRMNNQTFGGTAATSDIIVVRKRVGGRKSANAIDVSTVSALRTVEYKDYEGKTKDLPLLVNRYFIEHPENMGGEMFFGFEKEDTFRPTSMGLFPVRGADQSGRMAEWVKRLSEKDWGKEADSRAAGQAANINEALGENVKEGSMILDGSNNLCVARMGRAVPIAVNGNKVKGRTKQECFTDYSALKDALRDVLKYQVERGDDAGLQPLLDRLNKAYDSFVEKYGRLNRNVSLSWLRNDIDYPSIAALEKVSERGAEGGKKVVSFGKTDVFSRRVVEKEKEPSPKNVKDGIIASIYKFGRIDMAYLSGQLGKGEAEVKQEIIKGSLGFEDPVTGQMEVSYTYLSGNVREKLRQAKEANESSPDAYEANIKALEAVIPMDIPAHLIEFNLGSSWISPRLYEQFVEERTDVKVKLTNVDGTWYMEEKGYPNESKNIETGVRSEALNVLVYGHKLIEAALTNKTIVVSKTYRNYDGTTQTVADPVATTECATKVDEIRQDFRDWARDRMMQDPEMSMRMERVYNEQFNNFVPMTIPDEFIPAHFGGAATVVGGKSFQLRPHQAKAVIRSTTQPVLLAHEVGTGKTYTLITTAMEMRRLGTARKPMIVVQNATVGQFVASAKELYPNAKVLTIEDADRTAEGRRAFYAKIKYNDWDMIVVPQSVFERIPDSVERQVKFIQDAIDEKMHVLEQMRSNDPGGRSVIVRKAKREIAQGENEIARLVEGARKSGKEKDAKKAAVAWQNAEVSAREKLDREVDDVEDFDNMGIDAILVDEAHEYKHLGFATAMQRGVKGVDPSYSKKSQGVLLKAQAVLEKTGGRNVIFATGTPISNTAAEIWTFMRYLMPSDVMKEYGIYYFDDFVRNFGNIQQMMEFTTSGKYRENNRFAGYVNLPELVRIWSSVADTVLTSEAGGVSDKIPEMEGGKAQDIFLPQTRALRAIMKYVKSELDKYEKMSGKEKKENSHIPLVMYGIASAAAVDARLVQADAEDDPNSKTNEAVRQALRTLGETKGYNGTVAIFADKYQNKVSGFNLYEDIRKKLIAAGVPEEQIVVMKSNMTVKKKLEIFDKVNSGEIRVIMGSTFTLGTGVNIQERLHTLIHLDAPNRPMDYTQRNGRILRQGNLHKDWGIPVRVLRFGVEDSLDVTAYQRLKTKGAIADSIMHGKSLMENSMENRSLEEDQDLFGDITAQLSGSEYAMLKNQMEKEVRKLTAKRKSWEADQTYIHNRKRQVVGQNEEAGKRIAANKGYLDKVKAAKAGNIVVGKLSFPSVDGMKDFFSEQNKKKREAQEKVRAAGYGDRPITMDMTLNIGGFNFNIHTEINKEVKNGQGTLFASARTKMTYSCPELGIDAMPVKENLMKNAVTEIIEDVISGKDFRERIEADERSIERGKAELKSMEAREGVPFQQSEELEKAEKKLAEYEKLMKKEMAEKEAKYAEMDNEVEAATGIEYSDEDEEESPTTAEKPRLEASGAEKPGMTAAQRRVFDFLMGKLSEAGIDVEVLTDEEMRQLAESGEEALESGRKSEAREARDKVNGTIDDALAFVMGKSVKEARAERRRREQERRDQAKKIYEAVLLKDGRGTVYGAAIGGKIYLNGSALNPETPIHEYTHLWDDACRRENPELWKRGVELLKQTPMWEAVKNDPNYADLLTDDEIASEVHSRLSGKDGARLLERMVEEKRGDGAFAVAEAVTLRKKIRQWLRDFWNWVKGKFAPGAREMDLTEFVNMPLKDLMSGKKITSGNTGGKVRKQFIGEKGAERLDRAQEATTRLDNLAVARDMEKAFNEKKARIEKLRRSEPIEITGKEIAPSDDLKQYKKNALEYGKENARKIKMATGWERGADGKWRYEIPDGKLFGYIEEGKFPKGNNTTLSDVWDAPDLFEAYSELKDVKVLFEKEYGVFGSFDSQTNTISVNPDSGLSQLKWVFVHEIQHAIQHIEGFEGGGSPGMMKGMGTVEDIYEDLKEATNGRIMLSSFTPEGLREALDRKAFYNDSSDTIRNTFTYRLGEVARKYGYDTIDGLADDIDKFPTGFDKYQALSGEVEARNVETRRGMSAEERARTLAEETEDVAREDQIFLKDALNGGALSDDGLSGANDPVSKLAGKPVRTAAGRKAFAGRERERMAGRVRELAGKLHLDNVEVVTDASALEGRKSRAKGFYDKGTGKITIVLPNHASASDVEQTLLHEAVAHYGLRQLFGEHFDTFLRNVYENADAEVRRSITGLASRNGWDIPTATEEYLASLAEDTNFENTNASWWGKIKELFLKMLHEIGFGNFSGVTLSDNELRYILWRSYENLAEPGRYRSILGEAADVAKQAELKVGDYAETGKDSGYTAAENAGAEKSENPDEGTLFRDGDPEVHERALARDRYEQRVKSGMFQSQEALQDSMLGLKEAMDAVLRGEGKKMPIEDVDGFENAYLGENRLSSVNKAEADAFARILFKPLLGEVAKLAPDKEARQRLTDYMMAKHGLERNYVMRQREKDKLLASSGMEGKKPQPPSVDSDDYDDEMAAYTKAFEDWEDQVDIELGDEFDKIDSRDFAGLTALTGLDDVEEAEAEAQTMVDDYEAEHDTAALWDKTRAVSDAILSKLYETGMMSEKTYKYVSSMYGNYIPLRGFDEKTSEEAYAYLDGKDSAFTAPIKKAKGRKSKADDPFAYLQSMAESAIMQGNRNKLVKKRFLNFVLNHPSDLASVSDLWLEYDEAADEWKPVFPDNIESDDTPEEVEQKMRDFGEKMEVLAGLDPDRYKHGKDAEGIPYRVVDSRDLHQHQVVVKRDGRDYVITINGNPRAAQALNGQTNPDNDLSGAMGAILKAGERLNRELSAWYTTRNPDFVVSNFVRDMLYSNSMAWIKESPNYALRFNVNFARVNPVRMKALLAKYRKGTLDMGNRTEYLFNQFMMNGGETGFAATRDIESRKNEIRREIRKAGGRLPVRKAWDLLSERFDELNRAVENCARFAAYVTSIQMGRTVDRSVWDAKEISVNFNKKGSGAKFMGATGQTAAGNASAFVSGLGRSGYVFWNAAVQGTANFGKQVVRHPAKALTGLASLYILGAAVPLLALLGGGGGDGDDDKDSYWDLPGYLRRDNIMFRTGGCWVSIPLPIEYRAVYGLGELSASVVSGKERLSGGELAGEVAGQFSQLLPVDMLEGGGGAEAFIPSSIKPFAEAYGYNRSWTGLPVYKDTPYNKDMPEWTKAYKNANKWLVGLSEALNEASGGDKYTKGTVDINPAKVEHVLTGYFGGVANTVNRLVKTGETLLGQREYDPRSFLILNRLVRTGDERTAHRAVENEYFRLKGEHDKLRTRLRNYERDTGSGVFDYAEKIDFLYNSPEYGRYMVFEEFRPVIDGLREQRDEAAYHGDMEAAREIDSVLYEVKGDLVEASHGIGEKK